MKIISAEVHDPRRSGVVEAPYLVMRVDEEPIPLGGLKDRVVSSPGPQLRVTQHGMFLFVDPLNDREYSEEELCGLVNSAALPNRLDKVVPVEVHSPSGVTSFAMSVTRARANLRKFKCQYDYILSDVAARAGRIQWDLECEPPVCMHKPADLICGDAVSTTINVFGVQMPACHHHTSAVRSMAANLRVQRTGVRR